MRLHLAALCLPVLAALAACGSPCQDLGERICGCQPVGVAQDQCVNAVKTQLGSGAQTPNAADETFCQQKLATCRDQPNGGPKLCDFVKTPAGKVACGLAYPSQ